MSKYKIIKNDYKHLDKNLNIVFITSEFNRIFTKALEDANQNFLEENGFENIKKYVVPGAYEIPAFLKKVIKKSNPDLILCFGVVIRGETTHYDMVAGESAKGIMDISIKYTDGAIINGILTCEDEEQVKARISDTYALSGLNLLNEIRKIG